MIIEADTQSVAEHFARRLLDAQVKREPYEHVYIENVFPLWYYDLLLAELPEDQSYTDRTFDNRAMTRQASLAKLGPFWHDLTRWMLSRECLVPIMDLFSTLDHNRGGLGFDLRLVRDSRGYCIKPHTDIKAKAMSLLFYLPSDNERSEIGTRVYVPKEKGFTSDGTRRYEFAEFDSIYTAPFLPNSMFGFPRSDVSFHGVPPIEVTRRDVLLLNAYYTRAPQRQEDEYASS